MRSRARAGGNRYPAHSARPPGPRVPLIAVATRRRPRQRRRNSRKPSRAPDRRPTPCSPPAPQRKVARMSSNPRLEARHRARRAPHPPGWSTVTTMAPVRASTEPSVPPASRPSPSARPRRGPRRVRADHGRRDPASRRFCGASPSKSCRTGVRQRWPDDIGPPGARPPAPRTGCRGRPRVRPRTVHGRPRLGYGRPLAHRICSGVWVRDVDVDSERRCALTVNSGRSGGRRPRPAAPGRWPVVRRCRRWAR
jgi:hypothetical protein